MIAKDYDDMKNLKLFIRNKIFWFM